MSEAFDTGMILPTGPQDCGAFFLDAIGPYARSQVSVAWHDENRPTNAEMEEAIRAVWDRRTAEADRNGVSLYDGRLCRLIEYAVGEDNDLSLTLGPTSYRAFLGTNLYNAHLRYLHGPETLANPLGVSAIIVADDGYVVLGQRSRQVAYHAERIHPVGGCVEPGENGRLPDPFAAMTDELVQELGLTGPDIHEMTCMGLIRDKHIVQPELLFDVSIARTVDALRAGLGRAAEAGEHAELLIVRDHPASVVTFIESNYAQLTPVCLAGLLLHGLHRWGSGWFASTRGYLRSLI